jgi:hypothetical protein
MMALLPRLHLNRHTARSIIYGPEEMGGLNLPNLYTVQGIDKLLLFLGHLRLQDRTGTLIGMDLSILQFLIDHPKFFLNMEYQYFSWVEKGWITSLWEFVSPLQLQFSCPFHWTPQLPRANDVFLMEHFMKHGNYTKDMEALNRCRIYLKVLTLSDISSANGTYILPKVKSGHPPPHRTSSFLWPEQGYPSSSDWRLWAYYLAFLETKGKLVTPRGNWVAPTHLQWHFYLDPTTMTVFFQHDGDPRAYRQVSSGRNLQSGLWYDLRNSFSQLAPTSATVPCTIKAQQKGSTPFQIEPSSSSIASHTPRESIPDKELKRKHCGILQSPAISLATLRKTPTITCGGRHTLDGLGEIFWNFHTHQELESGQSLIPALSTRYRAKLMSILVSLRLLREVVKDSSINSTITFENSHRRALREAFSKAPLGVKTVTQPNYDLKMEIHQLRSTMTVHLKPVLAPVAFPAKRDKNGNTQSSTGVQSKPVDANSGGCASSLGPISVFHNDEPICRLGFLLFFHSSNP